MYCIIENLEVDIAQVIANEMKFFVENSRRPEVHSSAPIIFSCLVISLCCQKWVLEPDVVNEKRRGLIDDDYIDRYCKGVLSLARKQKRGLLVRVPRLKLVSQLRLWIFLLWTR